MTPTNLTPIALIPQQRAAATVSGDPVDLANYTLVQHRNVKVILAIVPAGADTDETATVTIEESATTVTSDFAAVVSFAAVAQEAAAGLPELHTRIQKRYVRAVATLAGTTPAFDLACILLAPERHAE